MVLSAPWPAAPALKVLFLITVPLASALVALMSMARSVAERGVAPASASADELDDSQ
jgi:hypothetical protein